MTFTPERLQRAKDRLAEIDVIGLQSGFAAFCASLEARFGWTLGPDGFMNRTLEPIEASDAFRAQIARDNADDVELYRFGCELLAPRPADECPRRQLTSGPAPLLTSPNAADRAARIPGVGVVTGRAVGPHGPRGRRWRGVG